MTKPSGWQRSGKRHEQTLDETYSDLYPSCCLSEIPSYASLCVIMSVKIKNLIKFRIFPECSCIANLETAHPYQNGASQWAGLSLIQELHTCQGSAEKHTFRRFWTDSTQEEPSRPQVIFTLWWGSIFRRRGGIMLTASCRLMLPCKDQRCFTVTSRLLMLNYDLAQLTRVQETSAFDSQIQSRWWGTGGTSLAGEIF